MSSSGAIKEFKFEGEDGDVKTISKVVSVNTHLVQYFDNEGKQQTRLVAHEPKTGTAFIVNGSIQGRPVIVPATKWFQEQLKKKLGDNEEAASI